VIDLDFEGLKIEKDDVNQLKDTKESNANTIPNYNLDQ